MRLELKYNITVVQAEKLFSELKNIFSIEQNSKKNIPYENLNIYFDDIIRHSYFFKQNTNFTSIWSWPVIQIYHNYNFYLYVEFLYRENGKKIDKDKYVRIKI